MKLLGIDFETTGLDPATDRIIEIGAVLMEDGTPLEILSTLVRHTDEGCPQVTAEVEKHTGITQAAVDTYGKTVGMSFGALFTLMLKADYAVAHNGNAFDFRFLGHQIRRIAEANPPAPPSMLAKLDDLKAHPISKRNWIDTMLDIPYPERVSTRSLGYLAAEHGFLNPFSHRAVFDVLTMLRVLSHYPIESVIESSQQPTVTLVAQVSFADKDRAKARGFHWHAERKLWLKDLKEAAAQKEAAECGFPTSVAGAAVAVVAPRPPVAPPPPRQP